MSVEDCITELDRVEAKIEAIRKAVFVNHEDKMFYKNSSIVAEIKGILK